MCIFHALVMHCIQPPLTHTFATLVMHWSIPCFFILTCHVYLMLCRTLFCHRIELHFLLHLAPVMPHQHCLFLHLLPSFLLDSLSILDKKGESILQKVYRRVFSSLYDSCAHPQEEKFYFSCIFVVGRYSIEEMHIPRGRRHCVNQKTLFCLFSCWLYSALSYALLFSSHHVCVLDMHTSLCYFGCMFG